MDLQNKDNQARKDRKEQLNNYARFSGIAIQMFAIIAIGTYVGVKLDQVFPNTHNIYTVILSLVSVILSVVYVIRRIIAITKDSEIKDNQHGRL